MTNRSKRILSTAYAVALAANSLTALAQDTGIKKQDKAQEKTVERQIIVTGSGGNAQTFEVRTDGPERGVFTTTEDFAPALGVGGIVNFNAQDSHTFSFVASEVGSTGKLVKGAPYSAEIVTESVQTLADGNRIVHRTSSNVARDSQGRTRREQSIGPAFSFNTVGDFATKTAIIVDPVEGVTYVLDDKTHTAQRSRFVNGDSVINVRVAGNVNSTMVSPAAGATTVVTATTMASRSELPRKINVSGGVLQGSAVKRVQPVYPAEAKTAKITGPVQVQVTISETGEVTSAEAISGHPLLREPSVVAARQWQFKPLELSGQAVTVQGNLTFNYSLQEDNAPVAVSNIAATSVPVAGMPLVMMRSPASEATKTSLGKQTIEGIECEGTRSVQTIPAGKIGNEQPIEIVSESWFSPALQVVVLSKHVDPRMGETTVRMTNVLRTEPDESLFKVPGDYTVQEASQKLMRTKTILDEGQPLIRSTKPQ